MERADSKSSSNLPGGNGDGASVAKEPWCGSSDAHAHDGKFLLGIGSLRPGASDDLDQQGQRLSYVSHAGERPVSRAPWILSVVSVVPGM